MTAFLGLFEVREWVEIAHLETGGRFRIGTVSRERSIDT
jgi:hypothetical protein